jgi:hypothetical protein
MRVFYGLMAYVSRQPRASGQFSDLHRYLLAAAVQPPASFFNKAMPRMEQA